MKVGVVGLGAMGAPMARNLHRAGLLAQVWNRSADKAQALAAETGCIAAPDPESLARACAVVISCVSADRDLLAVVDALLPGAHAGLIVCDCSTIAADTAREAAQRLAATGTAFLDTPVSGGVEGAQKGTLSVMAGGEAAALDRARPALEAISARITHMGPVGSGQATKAVNQIMCAGIGLAVTEALAFGGALGLDLDKVVDVVSAGAAGNWFVEKRGHTMIRDDNAVGFKTRLLIKDLEICLAMARAAGGRLPTVETVLPQYRRLVDEGFGDEDHSALFRLQRGLFPKD